MESEQEEAERVWVEKQRARVIDCLRSQHCEHAGVGEWPAFHVDPYPALWAVQSPTHPGRIGWWAISGDLPTDYMSAASGYHPRDAMRYLARHWHEIADCMKRGVTHPDTKMGTPELWPTMAPLLEKRAAILADWAEDDSLWD